LRLLIGGASSKFFHLQEFAQSLNTLGVESKLVFDADIYDGYPSRKISHWFQSSNKFNKLILEFKPDGVFVDRQRHFGLATLKAKIPLMIHLRGNFWEEMNMARKTLYKLPHRRLALLAWERIGNQCFEGAKIILPICRHLEDVVKAHYPKKRTEVLYSGITPSNWYHVDGMKLRHPCVGLLQGAWIWGKTKEMLTLSKVLEALPEVTFYWVGDGPYREQVISVLGKYDNFKWLGALSYPDGVREYLSEIDIYALISGLDMSPLTLQEAQLMEKSVIATNVGGIPEIMQNNKTGFLVEKGDFSSIIEKITILINDNKTARLMGSAGKKFVVDNFSWEMIAKRFINVAEDVLSQ
jgi:glycosyltransferase involved in cell wall biosynthesis